MIVIDGFISQYDSLRQYADDAEFRDEVSGVDGVVYPKICRHVPTAIREEIIQRVALQLGRPLSSYVMFLRQSPEGVHVPNQAHTDHSMGAFSLMLYLNRPEHCQGGTSFLRLKESGAAYAPESEESVNLIRARANNPDSWAIVDIAHMAPNRAVIFEANRIHRAEPVGGFGETNQDARVVLTCFFS